MDMWAAFTGHSEPTATGDDVLRPPAPVELAQPPTPPPFAEYDGRASDKESSPEHVHDDIPPPPPPLPPQDPESEEDVFYSPQLSPVRTHTAVAEEDVVASFVSKRRKKRAGRSARAGLTFSVSRAERYLRRGKRRRQARVSSAAGVYMTAVVEYLVAEIVELAGQRAAAHKHKRITPRDVSEAVATDTELRAIADGAVFPGAGVTEVHVRRARA